MQKRNQKNSLAGSAAVRTAAQFDAISSPVRDQILQVVVNQAPASEPGAGVSIREIGAQLGRQPGSLYRHIEELVAVGLLRQTGSETSGGRDATTYTAPGDVMELVTPSGKGAALDSLCRYIERAAAYAGKESAAATRARATGGEGSDASPPLTGMVSMFGWLDESQRRALHAHMLAIAGVFAGAHRRPGTRLIAASAFLRPVRLPGGKSAREPRP